ncbi:ABC transporter permease [Massilia sp. TN1-12]|uniref:ABC transporter permease n=1 Tax=Massilia paldalensis TaxID=3377675 RepID=UPI00384C744F
MSALSFELRLLWRSRASMAALLLLLLLSSLAVWSGLHEVARQRQTIARVGPLNEQDVAAVARTRGDSPNGGEAAYYTFYTTADPPSDAAFLAIGMRDVSPYVLRVRALGLQAQLYDGETFNPELALAGRFDFAFVLIYLAPLFVITLLHDVVSGERQAGRLRMLLALPHGARSWRRRVLLRGALVFACLALPACVGMLAASTGAAVAGVVLATTAAYLAFWTGISLLIASRGWRSVANATALMGAWAMLTLVLPALANVMLTRAVPVHQGVDLMMAQRQAVHGAWEVPREETMRKFFAGHPEWRDTAPLPSRFHWKWYFAFHQLGDESVAAQARDYRAGLAARQEWSERLGWLLPGVGAQAVLHRLAGSDLPAQLAYQDRIAAFHRRIREFYYPYLFNDRPFRADDYARRPVYDARPADAAYPTAGIAALCALAVLVFAWGLARLRRLRVA